MGPPNTPKPNPNSKCTPPMVNEDPTDMKSKCVKLSEAIHNPNSKCNVLMVNIDPLDMTSKCVPISAVTPPNTPKPNPNSKCAPPMVNEDSLDMTSKCLTPTKVIYIISPP